MRKSARRLGQMVGLDSKEVNQKLAELALIGKELHDRSVIIRAGSNRGKSGLFRYGQHDNPATVPVCG